MKPPEIAVDLTGGDPLRRLRDVQGVIDPIIQLLISLLYKHPTAHLHLTTACQARVTQSVKIVEILSKISKTYSSYIDTVMN